MKVFTKGEFEPAVDGTRIYVRFVGKPTETAAETPPEPDGDAEDGEEDEAPDGKRVRAWARAQRVRPARPRPDAR